MDRAGKNGGFRGRAPATRVRRGYRQRWRAFKVELVELRERTSEWICRESFPGTRFPGERQRQEKISRILRRVRSNPALQNRKRLTVDRRDLQCADPLQGAASGPNGHRKLA